MIDTITTETGNVMQSQESQDQWITTTEASKIMDVTREYVQMLCKQYLETNGESGIKCQKPGREYWVWREAAEEWKRVRKKSE